VRFVGSMHDGRAHARIFRISIRYWSEQERGGPGTVTAGHEESEENVLHVHYNIGYSCALWKAQPDSDYRQPDDCLRKRDDQI